DIECRFTRVNKAMASPFGLDSPEQAIGRADSDFFSEAHAQQTHRDEQEIMRTGLPLIGIEEREIWPDGRERWVLTTKMPLSDREGRIAGTFGISRDITGSKQAEAALREREQRFQAFMNNSPVAAFMKDEQGRYIYVNAPMERSFNADLVGKTDFDWLPEAVARQLHENDLLVLASGRTLEMLEPMPAPDGSTREWLAYKFVLESERGQRFVGGVALDITERRLAEEALRQREETLEGIISASPDIITILDLDGRIRSTSPAAGDILGYAPDEHLGRSVLELTHQGDRPRLSNLLRATTTGHLQDAPVRHRYRHANGNWVLLESNSRLLTDNQGRFSGAVVISRDVTEQARFEEELREARDEADRANRAKSEFLSRMSHELRTPLNAILGFTQLLEMDSTTDDQRESVGHIMKAGHHLLNLINEILDISRIEEGRLQMSIEPVLVEEVVQEVVDLVRRQAQQRAIDLQVPAPSLSRHYVLADRQRLMQVLLNLLSNAVKYNREEGSISVSCDELGDGKLRINVTDTGLGLSQDQLSRLFTPFERLGAEQGAVEGTGLGLALSKRLVEAMQGSIVVASSVGQGSTFSIVLQCAENHVPPLEHLEHLGPDLAEATRLRSVERQVLYIEDNVSNLRLIERILDRHTNIRLFSSMQGRLGLELAREQQPDLIILDLHLPDMKGDEVLRRLQAERETAHIPVVILSADATPGQVERLLAAGASAYLTKPLDVKQFIQVLEGTLYTENEK
ncbi:MAG: PAS domain-containing protein, partial [Chloroflexota bacterium]|nr:PAS domain-containing protein [Chloroflexota bacterium]